MGRKTKLTPERAREIRHKRTSENKSMQQLSDMYDLSPALVQKVLAKRKPYDFD